MHKKTYFLISVYEIIIAGSIIPRSLQPSFEDSKAPLESKMHALHSQQLLTFAQFQKSAAVSEAVSAPSPQNSSILDAKRNEHVCKVCSQSFTYKHNLKAHYRLHTGEKPYICRICKKEYTFYPSLKNHLLSAHYSVLSQCNDGNQKQQLKLLLSKKN